VLADVIDQKVSLEQADEAYGVVVAGGAVDEARTRKRREELAAARGSIDWTYDRGPLGHE
jgi:hypothetical protein